MEYEFIAQIKKDTAKYDAFAESRTYFIQLGL